MAMQPVVLTQITGFFRVFINIITNTQSWNSIHNGATEISVMNGRLFHLYPTTTYRQCLEQGCR